MPGMAEAPLPPPPQPPPGMGNPGGKGFGYQGPGMTNQWGTQYQGWGPGPDWSQMFVEMMREIKGNGKGGETKVVLEERHFRKMDTFDGDKSKFRHWVFDLGVAIGRVDRRLADELERLVIREKEDKWDPVLDPEVDRELYEKYTGEVYGVLCSLTSGEAKALVRGIMDGGFGQDGYRALAALNRRFDSKNAATLLTSFMEVVVPPKIHKVSDVVSMVNRWEGRMASLKSRYDEVLNDQMKLALLIGMLPQDFQDTIL